MFGPILRAGPIVWEAQGQASGRLTKIFREPLIVRHFATTLPAGSLPLMESLCTKNSNGSMPSLGTSDTAGNKPSPCRKEFATDLHARNREIAIDSKCLTLPILQRTSLGGAPIITTERKLDNPVNNIHASTWPASPPVRWQIFASLVI